MTAVPAGWRSARLRDVIAPLSARERPTATTTLPFIGMEHVEAQSGKIIAYGRGCDISSPSPRVQRGDVLYGRLRPYLNKVAVATAEAFASGEFIVFRGNEVVDARWLKWRLTAADFVRFAVSLNTGDRPRVKWPQMGAFALDIPPSAEQRRIVEILEDHISRLDAADASLLAATQRRARLAKASAAGMVDRAEHDERVARVALTEIATIGSGVTPKRGVSKYWDYGTVPWITSGDLSQGLIGAASQFVTEAALSETAVRLWPAGTLLVAMYGEGKTRGTVGELGIDATTNQACAAISLFEPGPTARGWLRLLLESQYDALRRQSSGGVQPNLSLGYFKSLVVPWPTHTLASSLVAAHQRNLESVQRVEHNIIDAMKRSSSLRRSLLAAAFSGKLTGSSADIERVEELAGV